MLTQGRPLAGIRRRRDEESRFASMAAYGFPESLCAPMWLPHVWLALPVCSEMRPWPPQCYSSFARP